MSQIQAYELAKGEVGTWEWAEGSNPRINQYAIDAGIPEVADDAIPWCATFVGAMLARAGLKPSGSAGARSYLKWGEPVSLDNAREGDIVVYWRGSPQSWQGHVGYLVRRDGGKVHTLGGNQKNQVNVSAYPESTVLGVRRASEAATAPRPIAAPIPTPEPETPVTEQPVKQVDPKRASRSKTIIANGAMVITGLAGIFVSPAAGALVNSVVSDPAVQGVAAEAVGQLLSGTLTATGLINIGLRLVTRRPISGA